MKKVIIFDLDGTAIPNVPNGMPSQRLINAIEKVQDAVKLCAATGRPITNAKPILSALKLKDPCVISAGTQIADPVTGEILWEAIINPEDAHKIVEICKPYHYEILVVNELMGEGATAASRELPERVNVMYIMGCSPSDAEVILSELSELENVTAAGVVSWTQEGVDVHVTHKQATKEHAVAELLRLIDVDSADAVGVGDADNDLHLFAAVGHKVAMENATDKLKSIADEVIGSVEADGLAKYLEDLAI